MTNVAAQGVCFALTGENTDSIFLSEAQLEIDQSVICESKCIWLMKKIDMQIASVTAGQK